jgi:hypothetical protein
VNVIAERAAAPPSATSAAPVVPPAPPGAPWHAPAPTPAPARTVAARPRIAPEVQVEPGQLEMLRQFARSVRAVPEAGSAVAEDFETQFVEREKGVHVAVPVDESGGEV